MIRNMDLIRNTLLHIEATDNVSSFDENVTDDCYLYHLLLLREAGLVSGFEIEELDDGIVAAVKAGRPRLTWAGHEFLDAARSDAIWNKVKEQIRTAGTTVTFSVLTNLLIDYAKQKLGMQN